MKKEATITLEGFEMVQRELTLVEGKSTYLLDLPEGWNKKTAVIIRVEE